MPTVKVAITMPEKLVTEVDAVREENLSHAAPALPGWLRKQLRNVHKITYH